MRMRPIGDQLGSQNNCGPIIFLAHNPLADLPLLHIKFLNCIMSHAKPQVCLHLLLLSLVPLTIGQGSSGTGATYVHQSSLSLRNALEHLESSFKLLKLELDEAKSGAFEVQGAQSGADEVSFCGTELAD